MANLPLDSLTQAEAAGLLNVHDAEREAEEQGAQNAQADMRYQKAEARERMLSGNPALESEQGRSVEKAAARSATSPRPRLLRSVPSGTKLPEGLVSCETKRGGLVVGRRNRSQRSSRSAL